MSVKFTQLVPGATTPTRATAGSAGYDLYALESRTVVGGEGSVLVPTGIALEIPAGYYARIAARSGLALKEHIAVNAGVIDRDYYPNPIGVILYCTRNGHNYTVKAGERCAQIIIEAIAAADNTTETQRQAGFGSTG